MASKEQKKQSHKAVKPLSPFEWMDKYKVPILLVCFFGLVGFGAWGYLADTSGPQIDNAEEVASFKLAGEEIPITMGDYRRNYPAQADSEEDAIAKSMARVIRSHMVESSGLRVSDDEFEEAFDTTIREPFEEQGDFKESDITVFANRFRATRNEFERVFRDDMKLAKMMREVDRPVAAVTMKDIYERYRKQFPSIKLKGVIFDRQQYQEQVALPRGEDDVLTAEGQATLKTWWDAKTDAERQRFHKGGPIFTTDFIGFSYLGLSDEQLVEKMGAKDETSGKSLDELTAEFVPAEADLERMKKRLNIYRDPYGLARDADLDEAFDQRKDRLTREWKIWKLSTQIHAEVSKQNGNKEFDLAAVAAANNLTYYKFTKQTAETIRNAEEFPGIFVYQMQRTNDYNFLNWITGLGENSNFWAHGPVDEPGKHTSIWRLIEKDVKPMPALFDVLDDAIKQYEEGKATELLDAAMKGFTDKMDEVMTASAGDEIARIEKEIETTIADLTKDLDPMKEDDLKKIEEIKTAQEADRDVQIEEAKESFRAEAFKAAVAETTATVIEEGPFIASRAVSEPLPNREKAPFVAKASAFLRREFRALHDQPTTDTVVDVETVSDTINSSSFPGMKGIAMLIEKLEPTVEEMFLNPNEMRQAEFAAQNDVRGNDPEAGPWNYASLKSSGFELSTDYLDKILEDERQRKRDQEDKAAEWQRRKEAREKKEQEEAAAAAKKAADERAAKLKEQQEAARKRAEELRKKQEAEDRGEKPPADVDKGAPTKPGDPKNEGNTPPATPGDPKNEGSTPPAKPGDPKNEGNTPPAKPGEGNDG